MLWVVMILSVLPLSLGAQIFGGSDFKKEVQEDLAQIVQIDSSSRNLAGLDRVVRLIRPQLRDLGAQRISWSPKTRSLRAVLPAAQGARLRVLVSAHIDTVREMREFPVQNLSILNPARMPLPIVSYQPFAVGAGVADNKGGVVFLRQFLKRARSIAELRDQVEWHIFVGADEEIGFKHSDAIIRAIARDVDLAFNLEPGGLFDDYQHWMLPVASSGRAVVELEVKGRAAHAAIDPERGVNAIFQLSRLLKKFEDETQKMEGLNVNAYGVDGSSIGNMISDRASCQLSFRYPCEETRKKWLHQMRLWVEEFNAHSKASARLHFVRSAPSVDYNIDSEIEWLQKAAAKNSQAYKVMRADSRSYADAIAEEGVPVIEAAGPYGSRFHSTEEFVAVGSFAPRIQMHCDYLLARLYR